MADHTGHGNRRTLPNAARIQNWPPHESNLVGDWRDVAQGDAGTRETAKCMSMPLPYADSKLHMSGSLNLELIETIKIARKTANNDDLD